MVTLKKILQNAYSGKCAVYEYSDVKDAKTGIIRKKAFISAENIPCQLSYEHIGSASPTETASDISQSVKLFLSPDIKIRAGSKIAVTQNGEQRFYKASGTPAVYASHQEIVLKLLDDTA